ncbi:MAG: IclR family transcriptional regulator [Candidatus Nanopelagicales bacterium]|jgi:DNA-binding IclR family transcriptional regulator
MGNKISNSTSPVQSVDRALEILEILSEKSEAGVTEIAQIIGVHKSTVSRLIDALVRRGLVEQISDRGKFKLGLGLIKLAGSASAQLDSVMQARPLAKALAEKFGETVNIATLDGKEVLYLDQVVSPNTISMRTWVGKRVPAHATATGKVLTAWLPEKNRVDLIPRKWVKLAKNTITDPKRLEAELAEVRKNGFAVAIDELEEELIAIAAPIKNSHKEVVAAIAISGPAFRMNKKEIPKISNALIEAAQKIHLNL